MELNNVNHRYSAGDVVYVFYRNPHTQDVANIQAAAVVNNPEYPNELALFLYETYYPLTNEWLFILLKKRQNQAYNSYYGDDSKGML